MLIVLGLLSLLLFGGGCIASVLRASDVPSPAADRSTGFLLRTVSLPNGETRKYSVFVPEHYDARRAWPTVMFLQGLGEGGTDGVKQTTVGLGPYIRRHAAEFNLIAVFPQSGGKWDTDDSDAIAMACLADVRKRYHVDSARVYLTGVSMGGYGAWRIGGTHAETFAAVVPMAGFDGSRYAAKLAKTPVWAFHNTFDPIVFSSYSKSTVNAINEQGGHAKLSVYGAIGHNCWDRAFEEKEFWPWLLKQSKAGVAPAKTAIAEAVPMRSSTPPVSALYTPPTPRGLAK